MKLLLDTDIGSDIDDAVCLAYLLAQPACDLCGITTVSGQPAERAKLASALCRAAGKQTPIFPGIEAPLSGPQRQPHCPQAEMLDRWPHQAAFEEGVAIDFLRQTIRSHPGEITLLAIGPMTNIATLFAIDPEIPRLLQRLVLMIGRFGSPAASTRPPEWNAWCDPQAAAAVFRAQPALFQSVGLDVTLQVQMETEEVRRRFARGPLIPVLDFAEVWFRERPAITFHDPLAAALMFDETLCAFEAGSVEVQLQDGPQAGVTLWRPGPGRHEVAVRVNPHRFFTHFFEVCDAAAAQ